MTHTRRPPVQNPRVTIVIPVFNGADYVAEAIESALAQTYENKEIIVVNDGSRDEGRTTAACRPYVGRVRYHEKENGGVSSALNLAIGMMEGDYFSWLSHDDRYLPDKVRVNVESIRAADDLYTVPFSNYEYIDHRSRVVKRVAVHEDGNRCALYSVLMGNLNGLSLLIHRDCLKEVGGFDEKLATIQDYDLYFKLALRYPFAFSPRRLVQTRLHGAQQGRLKQAAHVKSSDDFFVRCIADAAARGLSRVSGSECRAWYHIAYRHRRNGYGGATRKALAQARAAFHGSLLDRRARAIYAVRSTLLFPLWSLAASLYKKVRNL